MNKYVKEYFLRGLIFGGFGPIIMGVIFLILELTGVDLGLNGVSIFVAIISTYVLAFVHAGSSVFNQIEGWPIAKSMAVHFASIYVAYVLCYLVNSWIPFAWEAIAIFTAIFIIGYLLVWAIVYLIIKATSDRLNQSLKN